MALTGADVLKPTRPGADIGSVAFHSTRWFFDTRGGLLLPVARRAGEVTDR
jgi:hypothetical protein